MKISHGAGDGWKNIVQINVVEICKFEVEFFCIFNLNLVFYLDACVFKLRTCLFFKALTDANTQE